MSPAAARAGLGITLALAWLLLSHLGAVLDAAVLSALAVWVLVSLMLLPGLLRAGVLAWLTWLLAGVMLWIALRNGYGRLPAYAVDVLLPAWACLLFARSLARAREPLITRFVRIARGPGMLADPHVRAYTRGVTRLWAWTLALLASVSLALWLLVRGDGLLAELGIAVPWHVSLETWSLWTNALSYGVVAIIFVAEYGWRRHALPQVEHPGFMTFVRELRRRWPDMSRHP